MFNKMLSIAIVLAIALAFMCVNMAKAQVVTDGLVSYWSFDKATITGETAKDVWGSNDGTVMGGNTQIVKGKFGEALEFDGVDGCVDVSDENYPAAREESSVCLWFNAGVLDVLRVVFSYGSQATGQARGVGLVDSDTINFWGWGDPTNIDVPKFGTGEWHHLAGIYDGTFAKIYFDGEFAGELDQSDWNTQLSGTACIGRNIKGADYFDGVIDEVLFYNRALNEDEVRQNFAAQGLAVVSPSEKLTLTWGSIKAQD